MNEPKAMAPLLVSHHQLLQVNIGSLLPINETIDAVIQIPVLSSFHSVDVTLFTVSYRFKLGLTGLGLVVESSDVQLQLAPMT